MEDKAPPPPQDTPKQTSTSTLSTDHLTQYQEGFPVDRSKLVESDEKVGERVELVSDSITGVDGFLHPHQNNVCGSETESGEKQKMQDVCMEEKPGCIAEEKSIIESCEEQAKPSSGISGVKRKAETSERTSEEDTPPKAEEECQRKWYCSLCEISTTSEGTLNAHMQGKKHKAKEAKSKLNDTPIVTSMDLDPSDNSLQPNVGPTNGTSITEGEQTPVAKKWHCSLCQVSATSEALLNAHFLGKKHKAKEAKLGLDPKTGKTDGSENVKNEAITKWYCSVCQVYAASENNLQEHLQGKKHKAKEGGKNPPELEETRENEQEMKEIPSSLHNGGDKRQEMGRETGKYWHCKMCNEGTRDEASMNAHRKSDKHRRALRENYGGVIVVSRVTKEAVQGGEVAQE